MNDPLAFEIAVAQRTALGIPRAKAEAHVRATMPEAAAVHDAASVTRDDVLEKAEQRVIVKMARVIGITVRSTSQARAAKVAPGIPDLWLAHREHRFAGWWETKRQVGGSRSSAQLEFAEECVAAGISYGFGDRYAFARWLEASGFTAPPTPQD